MIFRESQYLVTGLAATAGVVVGALSSLLIMRAAKSKITVCEEVTYSDLIAFSNKCKSQVDGIFKSRVACECLDDGLFRVTQLMLDANLTAIRTPSGDVVGRILKCRKLDDKIKVLCRNTFPADFDFDVV